jgi:hypothetical protein
MANRGPDRDYLYLATHEVERRTGDVTEQHSVREVTASDLAVGDWFESSGLLMAYGVQAARRSTDGDAAIFVGTLGEHSSGTESSLLLSGPAEYLQDTRPIRAEDVSGGMSYPSALFGLLASMSDRDVAERSSEPDVGPSADDRRAPSHRGMPRDEHAREEQWLAVGYPIAAAHAFFGQRGLFPLSFLARAVKIVTFESQGRSGRWILGTPLWVAPHASE